MTFDIHIRVVDLHLCAVRGTCIVVVMVMEVVLVATASTTTMRVVIALTVRTLPRVDVR